MGCGSSKSDGTDLPELAVFPVPESEPGYPPPKPPRTTKNEYFNPAEFTSIDNNVRKLKNSKAESYEALVGEITNGLTTDLQKLRALYIWLGNQPIENQAYPNVTDNSTPRGYMKNIKHGRGSFTAFFTLLCRAAKLPTVIIHGKGKSKNYEVGDKDFSNLNSQWCAVYVDGDWRIVHALWSFRAVSGFNQGNWTQIERDGKALNTKDTKSSGKGVTQLNEYYFLTEPEEFIYKCRPDKDPWQLLRTPWSMDKYTSVPYCRENFFSSGLKIISENNCILKSEKGKCWLEFGHDPEVEQNLNYEFFYNEEASGQPLPSDRRLNRFVAYNNEVNKKSFVVRFSCVGVYKMVISKMVEFRLDCPGIGECLEEFPENPQIGYGYGRAAQSAGINSTNQYYGFIFLTHNETKTFQFVVEDPKHFQMQFKDAASNTDLSPYVHQTISDNNVAVQVRMPEDQEGDCVLSFSNNNHVAINYLISTDNIAESGSTSPRRDPVREALIRATKDTDIDILELAIERFEQDRLEDRGDLTRARKRLQSLYDAQAGDQDREKDEARIRERLRVATREDDIDELEAAIEEFMGNRLEDQDDLTKAKQKLLDLYTKALHIATQKRDIDRLEHVIDRAKSSRVCGTLRFSEAMIEAEETLEQLKRLRTYMMRVLALKQATVSEITSYKRPKPCIHDVMKATYLLLGEREKQLKRWEHIQSLTRKLGKESLIRRIKEFDLVNLKIPVANRSDRLLDMYDKRTVYLTSAGAGTFFKWVRASSQC
ncbi:hypothetical protein LOTGIDRAFT_157826 [Lottia gigantea]|uniref:KY-like immunoglobulin-like domain-containing protein n=1 Tax=Lottia gigantea TaxID=225164 RepID=V4CEY2_LOTGI|nr:hypothetical protein LOTGIDRAFT_157826 [Lottia gigantea]ESP00550.1 hypothetical protein LOTGIDRAFT_157826 [Lottia gigantea]